MIIGFDVISDLHLTDDTLSWEGKPTSLFCLIAGNVSESLEILHSTLKNLSKVYQGVFFIEGSLESNDVNFKDKRVQEIFKICTSIPNVVYLHNNVVVVDGVALVGINGWDEKSVIMSDADKFQARCNKYEDIIYLEKTVERLQLHVDVKKIIIISSTVPALELYYGEIDGITDDMFASNVLGTDTEDKIDTWVFGSTNKMVDAVLNGIRYINNPKFDKNPYYPKRIEVEI